MSHGKVFTMVSLPTAPLEMLHAFSHFSYSRSGGKAVVVDFQGKCYGLLSLISDSEH